MLKNLKKYVSSVDPVSDRVNIGGYKEASASQDQ